jgi:glycerol-3-phosphate dehydrogenase
VRSYGTIARKIFADRADPPGLGVHFGAGLYEREVAHLVNNEWAMTAEDVLWRRSKLGLHIGESGRRQLSDWLLARLPASAQLLQALSAQGGSASRA